MSDDKVEIKTEDSLDAVVDSDTDSSEEAIEEAKVKKPTKKKKAKKAEPAPEPEPSEGEVWWVEVGSVLARKGHSNRNIMLKAGRASGSTFSRVMQALTGPGSIQEKAISLFD